MKRKQIYIAQEQEAELERLAARRNVPVSLLIREAVAVYIAAQEPVRMEHVEDHPLWALVGIGTSPALPEDGSVNHDAALYGRPA